ncbi:MAG: tetratricopeptide repeat protein [Proteobacteria bacterium]|nr:tetratricopeptide repeat protein [Pseudomonadota bacterium]
MKQRRHRYYPWLMACLLASAIIAGNRAQAQQESESGKSLVMGPWAFKRVTRAQEALGEGKYADALEHLDDLRERKGINDHEKAVMWQMYGYVYSSQQKVQKAIKAFEKCVAQDALTRQVTLEIHFNLGQLYLVNKQYKKALNALRAWIRKTDKIRPSAHYIMAMAYVQTKDFRRALRWAKRAVASTEKPKESWLQMLLSIHYELEQYKEATGVLERLVREHPKKKTYWLQLFASYAKVGRDDEAFAVLDLANEQGFLTKDYELKNLAQLYIQQGVPYKGARLLDKAIKAGSVKRETRTLEMLAEAWLQAKELERAVKPLREAARQAKGGETYMRLASIHMERMEWPEARQAISAAIKKGKLRNPGHAYLYLGIVNFRDDKLAPAKDAFKLAKKHKASSKSADAWLTMLKARRRS